MFEIKEEFVNKFITFYMSVKNAMNDIGKKRLAFSEEEMLNDSLIVGENTINDFAVGICEFG